VHNEYPYIQLGLHFPFLLNFALDTFYVTRILVRVSDTIRIGYADTHFPKKH